MTAVQSERHVRNRLLVAVSGLGARLFRNYVGRSWVGDGYKWLGKDMLIHNARVVQSGLTVGSGDMLGWTPVVITPEMVGQTVAVFTSLEQKRNPQDKLDKPQQNWLDAVRAAGGIAAVVYGTGDAVAAIRSGRDCHRCP
jgi:hypothetical protein